MRMSPLAAMVLRDHRQRPDEPLYDIAVLGTRSPSPEALERLASAYRELEEAGLVASTGEVGRFRGDFYYLYLPAAESSPIDRQPADVRPGSVG